METIGESLADNNKLEVLILRDNRIKWSSYKNFFVGMMPNRTLQKQLQRPFMWDLVNKDTSLRQFSSFFSTLYRFSIRKQLQFSPIYNPMALFLSKIDLRVVRCNSNANLSRLISAQVYQNTFQVQEKWTEGGESLADVVSDSGSAATSHSASKSNLASGEKQVRQAMASLRSCLAATCSIDLTQ